MRRVEEWYLYMKIGIKTISKKYSSLHGATKASLWFLICSFLQKGISVITTPIFTRLLSTYEYGQYSVFDSWLNIITILVTLNLSSGVYMQGLVKFDKERKEYSSSLQGLNLILVIIWLIIYLFTRNFWNKLFGLSTIQMLALLIMVWATAVFNFWSTQQRVNYSYKLLVLVTLIASVLKPVISILLIIVSEDKVTARILGLTIAEIICYSGFFFVQEIKGKKFYSNKFWKYALSFGLPLIPHYLSQIVLNSSDRIMIGTMVNESAAGIYSLAYSVSRIMALFNTALLATVSPWIYQKIKEKKTEDIEKVALPTILGIAGLNMLLIVIAPEVVKIFAPNTYYEAIYVIPPVSLSTIFTYTYNLFVAFEFYYKKSAWISGASIVGAVLNIILNYFCINAFGYIAAGYTTLACYIVYTVMHYKFMIRVCDEELQGVRPFDTKTLIWLGIGVITIGLILNITYGDAIIRYTIVAIALIVIMFNRNKIIRSIGFLRNIKNSQLRTK